MADDTTTDETSTEDAEQVEEVRDEHREDLLGRFIEGMGDAVVSSHIDPGRDLWVRVSTGAWGEAAAVVRHRLGARYFGFLSAIDWMPSPYGRSMDSAVDNVLGASTEEADSEEAPEMLHGVTGGESRFQMLARVASIGEPGNHWGITLKADVADDNPAMPTWTGTYAGADWHERECAEMFGIDFVGHPGLRNIYLPSDFEGNPLRKDFPLVARMVKPWPGIVDVEPLPTDEPAGEAGGDSTAGSEPSSDGAS